MGSETGGWGIIGGSEFIHFLQRLTTLAYVLCVTVAEIGTKFVVQAIEKCGATII
jgi:hypothetical protein